jgi:hypothetical protein
MLCTAACSSGVQSSWGDAVLVARTAQAQPPGMALVDGRAVFTWIGVDERGVHHDARIASGDAVTLPLPPTMPRAQTLIAASNRSAHLVWLDADSQGVTQLYSALFDIPMLAVQRGPTQISDGLVLGYAAVADSSGGIFLAYSGAHDDEPTLILTGVDALGRPLPVAERGRPGEKPVFLWLGSELRLFWIDRTLAMVMSGRVVAGQIADSASVVPTPALAVGDRLVDMRAGADRTHLYLFWNIERASGVFETLYTSTALGIGSWSPFAALRSRAQLGGSVQTSYNSGVVQPALPEGDLLALASPLSVQGDTLPVLGTRAGELVVVYLQAGHVIGEQIVQRDVTLLAPPLLLTDPSRNLYAAWSTSTDDGFSDLRFVSSVSRR